MADVNVNFVLGNDEPIRADFQLEPDVTYTAEIVTSTMSGNHPELRGRDLPNQHPMSAITGLEDALEGLSDDITAENYRAIEAEEALDNKIDSEVDTRADEITRVEGLISDEETRAKGVEQDLASSIDSNHQAISNHVSNKNNPHEVTKAQVGLGNCDNTSDADKPVSTATQTALNTKVDKVSTANKVYGTDAQGNQTTYDKGSFGQVDDVRVGGVSVVTNKIANLGTMAGETASDYPTLDGNNTFTGDNELTGTISVAMEGAEGEDQSGLYMDNTGLSIYSEGEYSGVSVYVSPIDGLTVQNAAYGLDYSDTSFIANGYGVTCSYPLGNSDGEVVNVEYANDHYATTAQGTLADTALQPNDNISELTNNLNYQTATQVANSIATETTNRENADISLQNQIDAIVSASDVFDIVGTYAELQAYDISTVPVNDIIKVLVDSTHDGAATYYRCIENNNVKSWSYIGSEGAYYTKGEADSKFVPQTRTVNSKALSSDITLTASDVGALPSSTVIPTVNDSTVTIQKNGGTVSTFTLNQSSNETVNLTVPTKTSELTNDSGFITSSSLPTVNNGQLDIQVNGSSVATFTANQSGNTTANIVVPDSATWGNIRGDMADQTDLQDALDDKQDKLTAGTDISIIGGSSSASVVSGVNTLNMPNAVANSLNYVRIYGKCEQTGTPIFDSPIDIICNNGAIKWDKVNNKFYTDGTAEIITDSLSNTVIAEMLLSLGDYVDNQEILTGAIIRNVGVKVLDGTESFNTGNLSNCYSLDVDLGTGNLTDRTVYCTHFRNSSTLPAANNRQGYALIGNKTTPTNSYTVGFGATTRFSTATLFKDWLAQQYANGTPVIIVYPLTVPTTETVTGQILTTKQGDNTISVSQSSISSLNLTASYMAEGDTTISFTNATGYITGIDSTDVTNALGYTPVNPSSLATVATSGDYDDLINKPTIPTVGDGTITITQGGVTKGTFTTNQSGNSTIALDAGGAGGIQNTATGTDSLTILGNPASDDFFINIGSGSGINSTAEEEETPCPSSIAIGVQDNSLDGAKVGGQCAIAIGTGTNAEESGVAIGYASDSGVSGVAVGGGTSASSNGVAVGGGANASGTSAVAIGTSSNALSANSISIGASSLSQVNRYATNGIGINGKVTGTTSARADNSIGIGGNVTNAQNAIQLGSGTNSTANSLQVGSYELLDTSTGLIPDARISSNIARTSALPSITIQKVNSLPASPSSSILYCIPES